jgi:predicted transglutaminase-like cysteine proteinase
MSIWRYARLGAAILVLLGGLFLPTCFENTRAAENDDLFDQGRGPAAFSLAALEWPDTAPDMQSPEPFGLEAWAPVEGGIQDKWSGVKKRLAREHTILVRCRAYASACPPAAKRFLAVLDQAQIQEGWARIAHVNRAINLNIKPVDDMTQYGVVDLWATPLMAFKSNAGDCEDYAIAKYAALQELGIAARDLRLVVVHDDTAHEDHAVAAVRFDGRWLILDNRTLDMRHDVDMSGYNPLFVIDSKGVRRVTAWSPQPKGSGTDIDTASIGSAAAVGWRTTQLLL